MPSRDAARGWYRHAHMKPRIFSILWKDWPALLCLMCFPVIWLISGQLVLFRRDGGSPGADALMLAIPLSLVASGLLAWRIVRIHRLFSRGQLVKTGGDKRE